jgi:AFG3 family protein
MSGGSNKFPRGFQDFFPEKAPRSPPASTDASETPPTSKGTSTTTATTLSKDESEKTQKKQKQQNKRTPPPPEEEDWNNLPALLVLTALVIALRSYLEDESNPNKLGQEITFVDFRNHYLHKTEKIQVINKRLAKVVLKKNNNTTSSNDLLTNIIDKDPQDSLFAHEPSMGGSSSSDVVTMAPTTTVSTTAATTPPYFYIGSVETFEDKLTKAQSHKHPQDWVEVQYISQTNYMMEMIRLLPLIAFGAAVYFGSRGVLGRSGGGPGGAGGGPGGIFGVGKSTHKKIAKEDVNVDFSNVAGCEQAKLEIMEFVQFLKDSERFTKLGAKIPKGALLCGPPGTGKTLLAKAVAGEADVPFYSISGSDFIEMFVGVGPSRVRDLFKEARANAPCIVFIDEIDAVGRQRGRGGFSGGNDERENTLNQLLVEMDGFSPTTGVVVLAGTNRVDILDQALTRPGRFDRQITVDRPDLKGRKEIFEVHLKGLTLEGPIEEYAGRLSGLTPGMAGADIANLCNEAAIVAARRKATSVAMPDFEKATDRIIGGLESNKIMSSEEQQIVATHEAGHAIAGWFLEHADPLLKVTIIPRSSGALGFAQYLPKETYLRSEEQIMDIVCMALAGRAAEEVFFGNVTTGASDDLRRVTQLVYGMIKDFGMNRKLGQLSFPDDENNGMGDKPYSDSTAEAMDDEARAIVDAAYQRTLNLISEHKDDVDKVSSLLLAKETITHDDIVDTIGPRPFVADSAYQEFVSHRDYERKKATKESEEKKEEDESEVPGNLTPGLA